MTVFKKEGGNKMEQPVLTRRSFLKATAVTGMAAAFGGTLGLKKAKVVKGQKN